MKQSGRRSVIGWALYDWANSAFACTVLAGFFPVFFKKFWSEGVPLEESTLRLGVINSGASLIVAVLAPLLGAMADAGHARKRWLSGCMGVGVLATVLLYVVGKGEWLGAAFLFTVASAGWMGANVFYDSLLIFVAPESGRDRVSALGYSLGYIGGGLLFTLNVAMTLSPTTFGLADATTAVRMAFVSVGIWWALFAMPLFFWVPEHDSGKRQRIGFVIRGGVKSLATTFRQIRRLPSVYGFLLAYWLYIDGVDTIMRMAVNYGMDIGLGSNDLITALLITQFVGFPAALVFGYLGQRIGPKSGIGIGIAVYAGVTVYAGLLHDARGFYILAVVVGLVQGGIQALSRSLFSRLIPPSQASEFFGFYNMLGKSAAIVGPLLIGAVGALTGSPRWSVLSLLVLFGLGGWLLARVDMTQGVLDARAWESNERV